MLAKLGQAHSGGQSEGGPPHMVILHHTDSGMKRLAAYPELLAGYFEIPVADLETKMVSDPHAAVRIDVDIVRRTLPPGLLVSGLVYDTDRTHRGRRSPRHCGAPCLMTLEDLDRCRPLTA